MAGNVRAVAYVRVSKEREEGLSPEIQQAAIERYCAERKYRIVQVLTDLDLTGRFWKRRQVEQAISLIEQRQAEVLVVWKVSRVSRNRLDWAVAVDRIAQAGGRLESATEGVDASTSTGRFARGMLAELAAFESERIGETWRETHNLRLSKGLTPNGKLRWGYMRGGADQVPDPDASPHVTLAYERYVAGWSLGAIAKQLNDDGVLTRHERMWHSGNLAKTLDSGFAAGFIIDRGVLHIGAHETLISPTLWEQYQRRREALRKEPVQRQRLRWPLSALLRCGDCEKVMHAKGRHWICVTRHHQGPEACGGMLINNSKVMRIIRRDLSEYTEGRGPAFEQHQRSAQKPQSQARQKKELAKVRQALLDIGRKNLSGFYDDQTYLRLRDELLSRQAELASEETPAPDARLFRLVLDKFDTGTDEEKRLALAAILDHVLICRGSGDERVVPVWR